MDCFLYGVYLEKFSESFSRCKTIVSILGFLATNESSLRNMPEYSHNRKFIQKLKNTRHSMGKKGVNPFAETCDQINWLNIWKVWIFVLNNSINWKLHAKHLSAHDWSALVQLWFLENSFFLPSSSYVDSWAN